MIRRPELSATFEHLRRDASGAAIPEFAFILLPLILLLVGGLDLGYQAYLRSVVQGALNDVARTGSIESPQLNCAGSSVEDQIGCAIKTRSDVIARDATYTISMRNFYDFSGIGRSEKLITDYNSNGRYDAGDCFVDLNENGQFDQNAGRLGLGGADDVVFYEVAVSMPRMFPMHKFLSVPENYDIRAQAAVRNQPYAQQRTPPTMCA